MAKRERSRYSASFTAGGLLYKETSALLPLLQLEDSEPAIREEIKNNKLLHINTESARKRIVSEILKRTKHTGQSFWRLYSNSNEEEQKILLFFLCLKTYPLMFDLHFNVTLKQWHSSSRTVDPYYYLMEIEEIAARDNRVDSWKSITKRRVVSIYIHTLKDVKLLGDDNQLQQTKHNDTFWNNFISFGELWFLDALFLSNDDKERIIKL